MLICAVACITSMAQTLTGDWSGRLELGGGRGLKDVLAEIASFCK